MPLGHGAYDTRKNGWHSPEAASPSKPFHTCSVKLSTWCSCWRLADPWPDEAGQPCCWDTSSVFAILKVMSVPVQAPQTPAGNAMGGWGPVFTHLQDSMASLVEPSLVWTMRGLGRAQNPSPATLRASGYIGIGLLYLLLSLLLACLASLERRCRATPGALAECFCSDFLIPAGHLSGTPP